MIPEDYSPYLWQRTSKEAFASGIVFLYDKVQKKIIDKQILAADVEHGFFVFQTAEGPKLALNRNLMLLVKND